MPAAITAAAAAVVPNRFIAVLPARRKVAPRSDNIVPDHSHFKTAVAASRFRNVPLPERFRAKWLPVRVKKARLNKRSMIRKSVKRFSEKIMLHQRPKERR
jgi:hypothetical protein